MYLRRLAGPTSLLIALLASAAPVVAQSTTLAELTVVPGAHARSDVPVTARISGVPLQTYASSMQLVEMVDGQGVPVRFQLVPGDPNEVTWILGGSTPAGTTRRFELRHQEGYTNAFDGGTRVDVADTGESLRITIAGSPVLEYRYAPTPVPPGVNEIFSLSGYIHPLWSPRGEVLTRIQPPDHYHHYGIWNPWTSTRFQGRSVDFWNLGSRQGRVRSAGVLERTSGEVYGGFRAVHEHVATPAGAPETVAMREQWEVKAWSVGGERGPWLVDFASTLNLATDEPLTIVGYRYQGFSLRATERWGDANSKLLTSEGLDKSNANSTRARWIDVNGVSDAPQGASGILFLTNPSNYNFPEHLRIWPVGQNGGVENVFVNFNPAQDRDWELEPGRTYALRYRMLVYDGTLSAGQAERVWNDYADPPRVDVRIVGTLP
jgi:hypothetical protein